LHDFTTYTFNTKHTPKYTNHQLLLPNPNTKKVYWMELKIEQNMKKDGEVEANENDD